MSLIIACIENHRDQEIDALCLKYMKRIEKMHPARLELLPAARVKDPQLQKEKESAAIEKLCRSKDKLILCDEHGKSYHSLAFAQLLEHEFSFSSGNIIIAIGGAYGFTQALLDKHMKIRLTDFTLPHHLARLILVEQLYRGLSIIKGTGYHHE